MEDWMRRILAHEPDSEKELIESFSRQLRELARRQLPLRVQSRLDPEDILQSVYRSFFRRLELGEYQFDEAADVWQLLAAMTFRKARQAARFHQRQKRDVQREETLVQPEPYEFGGAANVVNWLEPQPDDVVAMVEITEQILSRLESWHRDVFMLRLEGYSIDEIAKKIERSESTVFRILRRVQVIAEELLEEQP